MDPFQTVLGEPAVSEKRRADRQRIDRRAQSCTKPGKVSFAERTPPLICSLASKTADRFADLRDRDRRRQAIGSGADDNGVVRMLISHDARRLTLIRSRP
jgi:hypothetical protein